MFYFWIFGYFFLSCSSIWLGSFPLDRELISKFFQNTGLRIDNKYRLLRIKLTENSNCISERIAEIYSDGQNFIIRHNYLIIIEIIFIVTPPFFVWMFHNGQSFNGFDDYIQSEKNYQLVVLLRGERLVPPKELPPALFATQEVLRIRPLLIEASRDWYKLDDDFSQRLLLVFKVMKEQYGYEMAILEGYRSPDRQNKLASMGTHVTNAKAFQSYHQFGLAADSAFRRDGKLVITEKDPWAMRGYQLYGKVAESFGLHWGGRWKMMDFGHVELRKPNKIKRL